MINLINLINNISEKSFNQARQCDVLLKVGSKNSVFSSLPIKNHFISVAFCLI